jgi:hypothetical protein
MSEPAVTTLDLLNAAKAAYLSAFKAYQATNGSRSITTQQIDKLSTEVDKLQRRYNAEQAAASGAPPGPFAMYADLSCSITGRERG